MEKRLHRILKCCHYLSWIHSESVPLHSNVTQCVVAFSFYIFSCQTWSTGEKCTNLNEQQQSGNLQASFNEASKSIISWFHFQPQQHLCALFFFTKCKMLFTSSTTPLSKNLHPQEDIWANMQLANSQSYALKTIRSSLCRSKSNFREQLFQMAII